MNRDQKSAVIDEVAEQIGAAEAIFAVDYRGITVSQVAELRTKLRDSDTSLRVVKNSLSERAADKAGAAELKSLLVGPTALAFVRGDAALAAKALSDTNRTLRLLDFKGGLMNGSVLSAEDVQSIARLPSREVLHGQLVGTIASPLAGLVRTLNALIGGLAIQLGQIAEQGLVSGSAAAPGSATATEAESSSSAAASDSEAGTRSSESDTAAEAPASAETGTEASGSEATPEAREAASEDASAPDAEPEAETETTDEASDDAPSDES